uniref:Uncharacterized protein n=1 Tax=Ditylenchus dipsaci TaxID=166011 RepID=A0A915EQN5_9BILA
MCFIKMPANEVKPFKIAGGGQSSHSHSQNVVFCETCPKPPGFELLVSSVLPSDEDDRKPQVNSANSGQRMEHTEEEENTDSSSSASEISKEKKTMEHENFMSAQKSMFGDNQSSSAGGRKDGGEKQLPSSKK